MSRRLTHEYDAARERASFIERNIGCATLREFIQNCYADINPLALSPYKFGIESGRAIGYRWAQKYSVRTEVRREEKYYILPFVFEITNAEQLQTAHGEGYCKWTFANNTL